MEHIRAAPDLILVGDEAMTPKEYAAYRNRRDRENAKVRERLATDPEYRERQRASHRRYRQRHGEAYRAYHREWMRRKRQQERQDAIQIRAVASLHSLRCTGPTKATGCRCSKLILYERVDRGGRMDAPATRVG